jgi:putative transposase
MTKDKLPERKRPIHGLIVTSSGPLIVYVTCCSKNRERWMANAAAHEAMRASWLATRGWRVGRYVIMPDHVHLFAAAEEDAGDLETWMHVWKRLVTGALDMGPGKWQNSHWDTRLRTQESFNEKWEYIRMNPVRKGLVEEPDDWPYAGELHPLAWQ